MEARPATLKKLQGQWVPAWGDNEEKCEKNIKKRDSSKTVKWKINAEKHRDIPNVGKIYASDYANEERGVKG